MSSSSKDESYLHFRAPRRHGEILCAASSDDFVAEIHRNASMLRESNVLVYGIALRELRRQTRAELATHLELDATKPWIVGGHQPELFHPGVWLKNFALDQIAQIVSGVALNLVVDHDLCNHVSLRVPTITNRGSLELLTMPWDTSSQGVPWERQFPKDLQLFDSFSNRLKHAIEPFGFTPLIESVWEKAVELRNTGRSIGEIFAILRHSIETKHGLRTKEFFTRQLVQTTGFRLLLLHLFRHREQFRAVHNAALTHYRLAHRIRSSSHPVPDLRKLGNEVEIPLWVHTADNPHRRPLFAGADGNQLYLTDQKSVLCCWALHDSDEQILKRLAQLEEQGTFLRPRALLTTMSLRLLLADWFVHGIGGGKYDQLNDRIIAKFFGLIPPQFSVISGTLFFPFTDAHQSLVSERTISQDACSRNYELYQQSRTSWVDMRQLERRHYYHPEKIFNLSNVEQKDLLSQKRALLNMRPQSGSRKQWHDRMERIRNELAKHVKLGPTEYAEKIDAAWHDLQQAQIRISREFSFAIYPETWLVRRLQAQAELCCEMSAKTTVHTSQQTSPT